MTNRPDYGSELSELLKDDRAYIPNVVEAIYDQVKRVIEVEVANGHVRVNHEEKRVAIYTEPFMELLEVVAMTLPVGVVYEVATATGSVGKIEYHGYTMGESGRMTFDSTYSPKEPMERVTVHFKVRM